MTALPRPPDPHIGALQPEHAEAIAAIEAAAAHHPWSADAIRDTLRSDNGHGWGAWVDGELAGHLVGSFAADEAELWTIAVHPHAQRQGVARALIEAAQADWRGRGAVAAFLEVRVDNASARALYASTGWEEVGQRRGYYADGATAVICRVALEPTPHQS